MGPADTNAVALLNAPLRGLLLMLAAVFCISAMDASAKWLTGGYPPAEIIFLGRLPAVAFSIWLASGRGGVVTLRTRRLGPLLLRGLFGAGTLVYFFLSLRSLPLADTVAITFVAPLLM